MQQPPRYTFFRRVLFPYSGVEALTFRQSLRVLLAWGVLIPLVMSLCSLPLVVTLATSAQKMVLLSIISFFSECFIFGSLGLLVVITNNWSARVRQNRKASEANNTNGDSYGS